MLYFILIFLFVVLCAIYFYCSVSDGYTRRNLRYLCDALRLEHTPIYDTPKVHRLDDHEDDDTDDDGDEDWRLAKRKRSQQQQQQQQRKKESSVSEKIVGFRIRKSAALWEELAARAAQNEADEYGDTYENTDVSDKKRPRDFVFTIPSLNQLMKEDMRGAFLGDPDAVVSGTFVLLLLVLN